MHDVDLSQKFHFAESDFLTALESGTKTLSLYHQAWSALPCALSTATKTGDAGNDTFILVNFVASRISNLASCFLDIKREEEFFTSQLQSDCDAMFHQMAGLNLGMQSKSLLQTNTSDSPCSPTHPNTSISNTESSSPPFLTSAYQWLLDNLHNPYPTAEVKTRIAATSSCKVSAVNSWFVNARRRIGWTTLCRECFSNCRADMIDGAYRALVSEDPQRTLSPELRHTFIAMKVAAEGLYPSAVTRGAFAGDLDAVANDMTEKDGASIEVKCSRVEQVNHTKALQDSYPSPSRSITASPVPTLDASLTDEGEKEEDVAPPIIAGSKRRRSSIEPVNQPSFVRRPVKRLRASMTSQAYLPSPLSSTDGIDEPSNDVLPKLSLVHSTRPETNHISPSRKRRLSDVDVAGIPRRSYDSMAAPRFHTASDPLPRSNPEHEYSIDDWLNTNFDALFAIPPPVDATEPDFSASWEVELFRDYTIPGSPKHALRAPPALTADIPTPAPIDLSNFDSLLQSLGDDTFITPSENAPPAGVTGAPYSVPFDSSISDMSQTNIDWMSFLNGSDACQPTTYSIFPQYPTDSQPLPEIDLSMLRLPYAMPNVNPQGDFASKQAKLHQLYTMQETIRQMEQELQAEGVIM